MDILPVLVRNKTHIAWAVSVFAVLGIAYTLLVPGGLISEAHVEQRGGSIRGPSPMALSGFGTNLGGSAILSESLSVSSRRPAGTRPSPFRKE